MDPHDYDGLSGKTPMPANAALVVHRAGQSRSGASSTAVSPMLRAIASCIAQFASRAMQLAHRRPAGESMSVTGDGGTSDAGQWIQPRAPLVLPPSDAGMIICDAGTIWITQGDTSDYVLNAGQSLALHPTGKVVVTAMPGPALVRHTRS